MSTPDITYLHDDDAYNTFLVVMHIQNLMKILDKGRTAEERLRIKELLLTRIDSTSNMLKKIS